MSPRKKQKKELRFHGIPASPGIAIGKALVMSRECIEVVPRRLRGAEIEQEIEKFRRALKDTRQELIELRERVRERISERDAQIFDAHLLILDDRIVIDETIRRIKSERRNADWVYFQIMRNFHDSLISSGDERLRERGVDVLDVKRRVIGNLQGTKGVKLDSSGEARIIVAHQLTPSQTVLIDRRIVLGFAVDLGGKTSHVAILSRALEKPAVVGLKNFSDYVKDGDQIILDGNTGQVVLNPTEETLIHYHQLQERYHHFLHDLIPLTHLAAKTLDGREIELSANLEFPEEVESVLSHGAKGVGLYRTEYLFLAKNALPSEEEQYNDYAEVASKISPNPVIIRTFDLGGDRISFDGLPIKEANPFLGWRAIRICLDLPEIFLTQLRAILRASVKGNVKIMFPMIASLEEVLRAKELLGQAKEQLRQKKIPFDEDIEVGIMVEVPAAVIIAGELAQEVDFMSIGTNDLTQYTLAVDRGNEKIADLYNSYHPAVLRLIKQTVEAGHKHGIWVGLCGEMATDPHAIPILIGLGLDELSVTPLSLLEVKRVIRSLRYESVKRLVNRVLTMGQTKEVEDYVRRYARRNLHQILFQ
ncbi:phosphoenolpyruvate--protein phosphotransferase [candidate division KSB1 bacterium]|nr:MAG: phosphoenolpyruvate--protein phosphotransferase [candidate division KSB1 bacterium]